MLTWPCAWAVLVYCVVSHYNQGSVVIWAHHRSVIPGLLWWDGVGGSFYHLPCVIAPSITCLVL